MKSIWISILILIVTLATGCSKNAEGTSTGNPLTEEKLVSVQFKSFSNTSMGSSKIETQSISSLKMCFNRLRFKADSGSDDEIDLELGEVTVLSTGTLVANVEVPPGNYERVEFDLEGDECASGKTIQMTNSHGSFSTSEDIRIRFEGQITISGNQNLYLDIQSIIDALATVTNDNEIDNKAESASGSF